MNNKTKIGFIVNKLTRKYFNWGLSDEELNDWVDELNEFDPEIITDAFLKHIRLKKGMKPNLADILGYCMEIHAQDLQFDAERYADALIEACDTISLECPLDFHSNIAHNAILKMGGWANIDRHYTNQTKLREDFINCFLKCAYLDLPEVTELEGCQTDSPYFPKYELREGVWVPVRRTNEQ